MTGRFTLHIRAINPAEALVGVRGEGFAAVYRVDLRYMYLRKKILELGDLPYAIYEALHEKIFAILRDLRERELSRELFIPQALTDHPAAEFLSPRTLVTLMRLGLLEEIDEAIEQAKAQAQENLREGLDWI